MSLVVTDHAILRYQDRIDPLSEDEVKRALDTEGMREAVAEGCDYHTLPSGHKAIIAGQRIVTILEPDMRPKKTRAHRNRKRKRKAN